MHQASTFLPRGSCSWLSPEPSEPNKWLTCANWSGLHSPCIYAFSCHSINLLILFIVFLLLSLHWLIDWFSTGPRLDFAGIESQLHHFLATWPGYSISP
jgi:hypothetical protein